MAARCPATDTRRRHRKETPNVPHQRARSAVAPTAQQLLFAGQPVVTTVRVDGQLHTLPTGTTTLSDQQVRHDFDQATGATNRSLVGCLLGQAIVLAMSAGLASIGVSRALTPLFPFAVDITINDGELVLLLGPSGCGKSTLLSAIAGLLTPASGAIIVDGVDVTQLTARELVEHRRSRVGVVFQS